MNHRVIASILVLAAGAGWWVLRDDGTPRSELAEASPAVVTSESLPVARLGDALASNDFEASREEAPSRPPALSTPLTRQRSRLHDTGTRLAARLDRAKADGAPEVTLRALEAHLERIEHQLAMLDVDAHAEVTVTDTSASQALRSPSSGS